MDDHVTQMHHFPRKQSISKAVGGMLSRTLSSSRSKPDLKPASQQNMVIGVSVEEATVEHEHYGDNYVGGKPTSSVQVLSKKRPSEKSLDNDDERSGWVKKAKGFSMMVKRKSRALMGGEKDDDPRAPNES
jgi:hypothetical protein